MQQLQKLKCLNALDLKLLAMALMLCDHLWATIVPGAMWLTNLGPQPSALRIVSFLLLTLRTLSTIL